MSNNTEPRVGTHSPWGKIDHARKLADGIVSVSTPSHGGIWLSAERIAEIPEALRNPGSRYCEKPTWWEEDCEVTFPLWFFGPDIRRESPVTRNEVLAYMSSYDMAWLKAVRAAPEPGVYDSPSESRLRMMEAGL